MTVIEFLTFDVPDSERSEWLQVEEQHWSRFLERQDGFVNKQIWENSDNPGKVHAVIWWESMEQWKAIPKDELASIVNEMGEYEREPVLTTFNLVRDC